MEYQKIEPAFEILKRIPVTEIEHQNNKLNEKEVGVISTVSNQLVNYIIDKYQLKISHYSTEAQRTKLNYSFIKLFGGIE